jgi:hypothetical protein
MNTDKDDWWRLYVGRRYTSVDQLLREGKEDPYVLFSGLLGDAQGLTHWGSRTTCGNWGKEPDTLYAPPRVTCVRCERFLSCMKLVRPVPDHIGVCLTLPQPGQPSRLCHDCEPLQPMRLAYYASGRLAMYAQDWRRDNGEPVRWYDRNPTNPHWAGIETTAHRKMDAQRLIRWTRWQPRSGREVNLEGAKYST